tara:strand:- start:121 stop:753 length:633 start_codon:yes stop_codon:yes gene_type:complete
LEKSFSPKNMSLDKIMNSVVRTPRAEVAPVALRNNISVQECVSDVVRHWFTERSKVRLIIPVGMGEWGRDKFIRELEMRVKNLAVCSADAFFLQNGKYAFNRELLTRAHAKCQTDAYEALRAGKYVVIANQNCQLKHIMEYTSYGRLKFNASILIVKFMPQCAASAVALGINNDKNIPASVYSTVYENMQTLEITRDSVSKLEGVMTVVV